MAHKHAGKAIAKAQKALGKAKREVKEYKHKKRG